MARIDEISSDLYRISIHVPHIDLQFNHFLVRDEEPLLFHTGTRAMFPELREAVARLIPPSAIRWIGWSHFESDECGALNSWLDVAPAAVPVCTPVGALVNVQDFANRPPRGLAPDERLETGRRRFRLVPTPHLPHGWDASVLFDETDRILLCSDLFHQLGDREPMTGDDVLARWAAALDVYQKHPVLMDYVPFTPDTARRLADLAALQPSMVTPMHGSSFTGDCAGLLANAAAMLERHLARPAAVGA